MRFLAASFTTSADGLRLNGNVLPRQAGFAIRTSAQSCEASMGGRVESSIASGRHILADAFGACSGDGRRDVLLSSRASGR